MASSVKQGYVVFRHFSGQNRLQERTSTFSSIEELFELCLATENTGLVDRIEIEGVDADGKNHHLTLVFQSLAIKENK